MSHETPATQNDVHWLVVMPTWLGDVVMATPTLAALRRACPTGRITMAIGKNLAPLLAGCPDVDQVVIIDNRQIFKAANQLRRLGCERAILLPNSFRSAMITKLARIPIRIGYDRDRRGWLLTDRLDPPRDDTGRFAPVPTLRYYLELARLAGADPADMDPAMSLAITDDDRTNANTVWASVGLSPTGNRIVVLNPGAQKAMKRWPTDRFAKLATSLNQTHNCDLAVTGSPAEMPILEKVAAQAKCPIANLAHAGLTLGGLKAVISDASLLVTNDTGPRHIAAAMNTPVVTMFGPTPPQWTTIDFKHEIQIVASGICEQCEADHKTRRPAPLCMHTITVDQVVTAAQTLLDSSRELTHD